MKWTTEEKTIVTFFVVLALLVPVQAWAEDWWVTVSFGGSGSSGPGVLAAYWYHVELLQTAIANGWAYMWR